MLTCGSWLPVWRGAGREHNERVHPVKGFHPPFTHSVPQRRRALPMAPESADSEAPVPRRPLLRAPALCPPRGPRPPGPQYLCHLFCRSPGKRRFVPAMLGVVLLSDLFLFCFGLGEGNVEQSSCSHSTQLAKR